MEKFPRLFRRAIPFKMNIKLEDFVKEYICMEQDIHVEDLQESVMQYGRMRGKIEETMEEVRWLREIAQEYEAYAKASEEEAFCSYQIDRLEILQMKAKLQEFADRRAEIEKELKEQEEEAKKLEVEQKELQRRV